MDKAVSIYWKSLNEAIRDKIVFADQMIDIKDLEAAQKSNEAALEQIDNELIPFCKKTFQLKWYFKKFKEMAIGEYLDIKYRKEGIQKNQRELIKEARKLLERKYLVPSKEILNPTG